MTESLVVDENGTSSWRTRQRAAYLFRVGLACWTDDQSFGRGNLPSMAAYQPPELPQQVGRGRCMLLATGPQQFYESTDQNVSTNIETARRGSLHIHLYGACFTQPVKPPVQGGHGVAVGKNLGQNSANTRHARARGLEAPNRGHLQALTVRQCSLAFARGHLQSALRATPHRRNLSNSKGLRRLAFPGCRFGHRFRRGTGPVAPPRAGKGYRRLRVSLQTRAAVSGCRASEP